MMSRFLLALTVSVSLSACVSLLPDATPASSIYRLTTTVQPVEASAAAEIIRVARPSSAQVFKSNDIVVTKDGQKLSTIAQAKWSQSTPDIIQNAMVEALGSSSQFIGLIPTDGVQSDSRLHLSVKNFEANFDNGSDSAPLAVVQYRVTYVRAADRSLIGTHTVRETVRAQSINVTSIVAALEQANSAAMADVVSWLETQKSSDRS